MQDKPHRVAAAAGVPKKKCHALSAGLQPGSDQASPPVSAARTRSTKARRGCGSREAPSRLSTPSHTGRDLQRQRGSIASEMSAGVACLCQKNRPKMAGQPVLQWPLSVPSRAPGCPELRQASANQPLGPRRRPGHVGLVISSLVGPSFNILACRWRMMPTIESSVPLDMYPMVPGTRQGQGQG